MSPRSFRRGLRAALAVLCSTFVLAIPAADAPRMNLRRFTYRLWPVISDERMSAGFLISIVASCRGADSPGRILGRRC